MMVIDAIAAEYRLDPDEVIWEMPLCRAWLFLRQINIRNGGDDPMPLDDEEELEDVEGLEARFAEIERMLGQRRQVVGDR